MKAHIFIRSHAAHFEWLSYALRSIAKYCRGFTGITVTIPERDRHEWDRSSIRTLVYSVHSSVEGPKGFLEGQLKLCRCDEIVPKDTTHVLLTDSDCIFKNPTVPEDYTINGKPIMIGARFADMTPDMGQLNWQNAAQSALGFRPEFEFMSRHPAFYPTWVFPLFREAVERNTHMHFDDYVLSCRNEWPQTFAELTTIGAFCHKYFPTHFAMLETRDVSKANPYANSPSAMDVLCPEIKADSGNPAGMDHLKAFWSPHGVNHYRAELDAMVS